jgi:hypothetical protein
MRPQLEKTCESLKSNFSLSDITVIETEFHLLSTVTSTAASVDFNFVLLFCGVFAVGK